jgi:hypothetical protein
MGGYELFEYCLECDDLVRGEDKFYCKECVNPYCRDHINNHKCDP